MNPYLTSCTFTPWNSGQYTSSTSTVTVTWYPGDPPPPNPPMADVPAFPYGPQPTLPPAAEALEIPG